MKQLHIKSVLALVIILLISFTTQAQHKLTKASQSLKVNKDVTINLESNYSMVKIDTWNKDIIEVEAFIESDKLSEKELQSALQQWHVDVSGSDDFVNISSSGQQKSWEQDQFFYDASSLALKDLEFELAEIPPVPPLPALKHLQDLPPMPAVPSMPQLPELPKGIGEVHFDYEAYKKEGEAYLDKWSKTYQNKFGKEYQEKMKAWAKKFSESGFEDYEKQMEAWGEQFGKEYGEKMEAWGKQFGESFGKDFEKSMEAWGKSFEKQMEAQEKRNEAAVHKHQAERARVQHLTDMNRELSRSNNPAVKKTLIIHMPKKAKLKLNVKYGELQFVSAVENLKAEMSHTKLTANTIDGSQTSINVSYAPVSIANWNQGQLKLNFVESARLKSVNQLVLNSNSSNITMEALGGNAIIDGSFGNLKIQKILDGFHNLNIILENSDAVIALPKINYNFQFKGKLSKLKHPGKSKTENVDVFSTGDVFSDKSIIVNAKYSKVLME